MDARRKVGLIELAVVLLPTIGTFWGFRQRWKERFCLSSRPCLGTTLGTTVS